MRCQVYIPKELEEVLLNDAKKAGVNVSEIIIRILKKNYKTKNSETLDYIALKDIVFKEIEEYISTLNINDEFELYDASETFRNIPMTKEGKPNVNRAKLGRLDVSMRLIRFQNRSVVPAEKLAEPDIVIPVRWVEKSVI